MKRILLLLFGLFVVSTAFSQFKFGPKVGYTTSRLSVDQSDISTSFKNSFLFGAFARIGDKVYIQPEINWHTSGTVFKRPSLSSISPIEQDITLSNIQIPLYVGVKIIDLRVFNLRLMGGGTANIVVNKTIESLQSESYIEPIKESDISNLHWGVQFGVGIDVAMFTLDVQSFFGLSNVIGTINVGGTPIQFDSRKQGFVVSLGWKIL